jgi:hypothetical protein
MRMVRAGSISGRALAACACALALIAGTAVPGAGAGAGAHAYAAKKKCKKKHVGGAKKCKKGDGSAQALDLTSYLSGHRFSSSLSGSAITYDFCASGSLTITRTESAPSQSFQRRGMWAVTSSAANQGTVHFVPTSASNSNTGPIDPGDPEDFPVVAFSPTQADIDIFTTTRSDLGAC